MMYCSHAAQVPPNSQTKNVPAVNLMSKPSLLSAPGPLNRSLIPWHHSCHGNGTVFAYRESITWSRNWFLVSFPILALIPRSRVGACVFCSVDVHATEKREGGNKVVGATARNKLLYRLLSSVRLLHRLSAWIQTYTRLQRLRQQHRGREAGNTETTGKHK